MLIIAPWWIQTVCNWCPWIIHTARIASVIRKVPIDASIQITIYCASCRCTGCTPTCSDYFCLVERQLCIMFSKIKDFAIKFVVQRQKTARAVPGGSWISFIPPKAPKIAPQMSHERRLHTWGCNWSRVLIERFQRSSTRASTPDGSCMHFFQLAACSQPTLVCKYF